MFAEEQFIGFLHTLGLHRGQARGRQAQLQAHERHHSHQLYQLSTLNAIMEGAYDGELSIHHLRQHGDFGLGTFNGLDGEMIMVDGQVFQACADGRVLVAHELQKTPFAVVQFFTPEWHTIIDAPLTFAGLPTLLAEHLPSTNYFYALRIDGQMRSVRARSIARQQKPYRPLVAVTKDQRVFEFTEIAGTIVGFRFPDYAQGVNMPGWHLHFVSEDRQHGGHVLDFTVEYGELQIEHTSDFYMELPESPEFAQADLRKNQADAIARVEK